MKIKLRTHLPMFLATATLAWAQPPSIESPDAAPPPPPPPRGGPPIERFFETLERQDRKEFDRLRRLREADPAAFRAELAERIHREKERRERAGFPDASRAEREMRRPTPPQGRDHPPPVRSPELDAAESRARELARALLDAKTDDEREKRKAELRREIARAFDLRDRLRREQIREMRERLDRVEQRLNERAANREAIIERRLNELIGADVTAW